MDLCAVSDLEAFFVGSWRLERVISDPAGVRIGSFAGSLVFTPEQDRLVYHEQGVLELGAHRGPASRTLHYAVTGPGQALVHFDYGDFFHEVDLREGWWTTEHPCRDDLYEGEYRVLDVDHWWQRWVVAGPTKNHVMVTDFWRDSAACARGAGRSAQDLHQQYPGVE